MLFKPCSDSKSLSLPCAAHRLIIETNRSKGQEHQNHMLVTLRYYCKYQSGKHQPFLSPSLIHLLLLYTSISRDSCWLFSLKLIPDSQFQDQVVDF